MFHLVRGKEEFLKLFREVSSTDAESEPAVEGAASLLPPPQLTVAQEKKALLKRLAELEEKEKIDLEAQLREKKEQLEIAQKDFRSQKDKFQKALGKLDSQVTALKSKLSNLNREEGQRVKTLQLEISIMRSDLAMSRGSHCVCVIIRSPPADVTHHQSPTWRLCSTFPCQAYPVSPA